MTPSSTTSHNILQHLPAVATSATTSAKSILPRETTGEATASMEDEIDYESIPNASISTNMMAGALAGSTFSPL
jgi:hypothetical protein